MTLYTFAKDSNQIGLQRSLCDELATADATATYLSTGRVEDHVTPFSPARFAPEPVR